jgi:hypothetical protein
MKIRKMRNHFRILRKLPTIFRRSIASPKLIHYFTTIYIRAVFFIFGIKIAKGLDMQNTYFYGGSIR